MCFSVAFNLLFSLTFIQVSEAESLVAEPAAAALSVVDAGSGRPVAVHPPAMRQAIAWTLALRSLRKDLEARAEEMLKSQTGEAPLQPTSSQTVRSVVASSKGHCRCWQMRAD